MPQAEKHKQAVDPHARQHAWKAHGPTIAIQATQEKRQVIGEGVRKTESPYFQPP